MSECLWLFRRRSRLGFLPETQPLEAEAAHELHEDPGELKQCRGICLYRLVARQLEISFPTRGNRGAV